MRKKSSDMTAIFDRRRAIDTAMRRAAEAAMVVHRAFGTPIPVWQDGRVRMVSPEAIVAAPRRRAIRRGKRR